MLYFWNIQFFVFLTMLRISKMSISTWNGVHFWVYFLIYDALGHEIWHKKARTKFFGNILKDLEEWGEVPGPFIINQPPPITQ